jgi:hypothetical protein
MVPSLRLLASSRAQESCRLAYPHSSAPQVIATPEDGVGAYATPYSDNPDATMGLH